MTSFFRKNIGGVDDVTLSKKILVASMTSFFRKNIGGVDDVNL